MGKRLKSCPFCGKRTANIVDNYVSATKVNHPKQYQVFCGFLGGGCGSSSGWYSTKDEAIEAWNRRIK